MPTNRLRLIVVDDHPDCGMALTLLLRSAGHFASTCLNAFQTLEQLEPAHPDALVLDIGMSGMDGLELATKVKQLHPEIPLIAVTGRTQPADRQRAEEAGISHFFPKPVDVDALVRVLGTLQPLMP